MKTLEDFKDEVAAEYYHMGLKFKSWAAMINDMLLSPSSAKNTILRDIDKRTSDAAERYAKYCAQQAHEEAKVTIEKERENLSERISVAVSEAESEWQDKLRGEKRNAFNEGYEARMYDGMLAKNPYNK